MKLTEELQAKIDAMSPLEMARISRNALVSDPLFQGESGKYFEKSFIKKGGMSPEIQRLISKKDEDDD